MTPKNCKIVSAYIKSGTDLIVRTKKYITKFREAVPYSEYYDMVVSGLYAYGLR